MKAPRLVTALDTRLPAGVRFAIGSAVLFDLSTPCAKALVGRTPPLLLAGLLYVGSFVGLTGVPPLDAALAPGIAALARRPPP